MNIGIIGYGIMGSAIAGALKLRDGADTTTVFDVDLARRALAKKEGLSVEESVSQLLLTANILILAVKPQQAHVLAPELKGRMEDRLVVSVMAGISLDQLEEMLDTSRIIRTMPNTPTQIGQGFTVWIAGSGATSEDKIQVATMLSTFGEVFEVKNEDMINAATAISGSGPAYVFLLAQALEESAVGLGFDRQTARLLVSETLRGSSALYYGQRDTAPEELRRRVTSPGGTTNAAMEELGVEKFIELWKKATKAAYERARELAR